jgi:hypothetical protein
LALSGSTAFFHPIPFDETFMDFSNSIHSIWEHRAGKILKVEANFENLQRILS